MFSNAVHQECKTRRLHIQDSNAQAVKSFIEFLYRDMIDEKSLPADDDLLMSILHLAEKYDVPSLKASCEFKLKSKVNFDNLSSYVALANRYNLKELSDFCTNMAWSSFPDMKEVFETLSAPNGNK